MAATSRCGSRRPLAIAQQLGWPVAVRAIFAAVAAAVLPSCLSSVQLAARSDKSADTRTRAWSGSAISH